MNLHMRTLLSRPRQVPPRLGRGAAALILLATALGPTAPAGVPQALASSAYRPLAAPLTFTLEIREYDPNAISPGTGPLIPHFTYMINEDNTGDPFDSDPNNHPGLKPMASHSPILGAGDDQSPTFTLDVGRYLISVRGLDDPNTAEVEDYKLWGRHVRVCDPAGPAPDPNAQQCDTGGVLLIELVKGPLPLSQLQVHVFHDRRVNSAPDGEGVEPGLEGFHIVLHDPVGEVTVDWFGNPICTQYSDFPGGTPIPGTGGFCATDADGNVLIPNIPYGQYDVFAIPADGSGWIQTSTFEGGLAIEHARLEEGSDGFGATAEALREPLILPTAFWFGFVQECQFGNTSDSCGAANDTAGTGTITGKARTFVGWPPFEQLTLGEPVSQPWIALSNTCCEVEETDTQVYTARGNADGTFTIPNVPAGSYLMSIWDDALDWIISYRTVIVANPGDTVNMGDIGVPRWFGWVSGHVFFDANEDGIKDPDEVGIPNIDLDIRFRDGSVKSATFTDSQGYYEYPEELGPLFKFDVAEVGFGRFHRTGHSLHDPYFANHPDLFPDSLTVIPQDLGGGLLLNQLTQPGHRTIIDWGKAAYPADDSATPLIYEGGNGGISGVVIFATTRNEFDARLAAAEDYEPGIPNATMRLWGLGADGLPNTPDDVLLNELQTDAWSHPRFDHPDLAQECDVRDKDTNVLADPNGAGPKCLEYPLLSNETKAGAFDGGYAFESMCPAGFPCDPADEVSPLPPGDYVVEVVPPAYYQVIKEEDQNTDEGNDLVPAFPPPPCVGDQHLVLDSRNPFDGTNMPLCNKRLVTVTDQQNPAADFFLFTTDLPYVLNDPASSWTTFESVPIPGRIFGLVKDDLIFDTDPNSLWYGEERPVPYAPIGIRDYTGRLLITVHTDENGFYEVLLPSTFQANCPIPSGICPGMYIVVVNDPGGPFPGVPPDGTTYGAPNELYRPTYLTEPAPFEVWPGKMTVADTPVDPTGHWNCQPATGRTEFLNVSRPYGSAGDSIVINGLNFGDTQGTGSVTLDGVAQTIVGWSNQIITMTVAGPPGPHQLVVSTDSLTQTTGLTSAPTDGLSNPVGLTFHVIGTGYSPPIVEVNPGTVDPSLPPPTPIQDAIDAAAPGTLIVVNPGTYRENVILHKRVRLQGVGPGGIAGTTDYIDPIGGQEDPRFHIPGSVIDARYFGFNQTAWDATLAGPATPFGNPSPNPVPGGAGITVVADTTEFDDTSFTPQIDGFWITSATAGGGGGVHVHAFGRNLRISNNIIEANGGTHGGGVSLGIREVGNTNYENDNPRIDHNRVLNNGSTSAGAGIGIFNGADNYEIDANDICGNFSGNYGGGIAHFGLSPNGRIHNNKINFNDAFDSGGGVLIAGALPVGTGGLGSGPVDIKDNMIGGNLSNDDGGGIMLLEPLHPTINIINNWIIHNVATDIGGGITLDDASDVRIINNTLAYNHTTATAEDRDTSCEPSAIFPSCPHGAGLVSEANSGPFQATLPPGSPNFSDPVLFNNIFWANQAWKYDATITPSPVDGLPKRLYQAAVIDLEVFTPLTPGQTFSPQYSLLSAPYAGGANNIVGDLSIVIDEPGVSNLVGNEALPQFVEPATFIDEFNVGPNGDNPGVVTVEFWRADFGALDIFVDFHVLAGSPVIDAGTASLVTSSGTFSAPCDDYDGDGRPLGAGFDIGADEQPGAAACPPPPPPPILLYFSTETDFAVPGVAGPHDDADIYAWDGTAFSRVFDASAAGLPATADIDALRVVDSDTFYVSFAANVSTIGARREDIMLYDAGTWSLYFDGSDVGLTLANENVDGFEFLSDGSLVISTLGDPAPTGPGTPLSPVARDEDLLRCVGTFGATTTCTWSYYFDGSDVALTTATEDVDDTAVSSTGDLYLTTLGAFTVTSLSGAGEDVFVCAAPTTGAVSACASFSLYFDGSANGITDNLDAFDLP